MKIRWIGFSSRVFGATARIAPSVANAVLSAAMTSRCLRLSVAIACGRSAVILQRLLQRLERDAMRVVDGGQIRPETPADEHRPIGIQVSERFADCRLDADIRPPSSQRPPSGWTSGMSARRSVYFHSSTRRWGTPSIDERIERRRLSRRGQQPNARREAYRKRSHRDRGSAARRALPQAGSWSGGSSSPPLKPLSVLYAA